MNHGYVVGIDFGLKHIGVAVGQTVTKTANGLTTLRAKNGKPDWTALQQLIAEYKPLAIVVGLPLNMDASASDMSDQATLFATQLSQQIQTPVMLADERLSSWAVKDEESAAGQDIHARSACLITQTYLNDPSHCTAINNK
ncbi:MAG: Holliday junction resolvase RuvX [Proteobacteria bacterium]|nr:Holliday junction resolvase RuvX [Pseudomonadota bacterium]